MSIRPVGGQHQYDNRSWDDINELASRATKLVADINSAFEAAKTS